VHQLRQYLEGLLRESRIAPFNTTVMTFSLISQLHWLYFWFKPDKGLSLEEVIDQIADMFLAGVLVGSGSGRADARRLREDA
jgi:hypothetical protein